METPSGGSSELAMRLELFTTIVFTIVITITDISSAYSHYNYRH